LYRDGGKVGFWGNFWFLVGGFLFPTVTVQYDTETTVAGISKNCYWFLGMIGGIRKKIGFRILGYTDP
jgi:hypothetical protein